MRQFLNADEFPETIAEKLNEFLETSHTVISVDAPQNDYEYFNTFCEILRGYGYSIFSKYNKTDRSCDFYAIGIDDFKNIRKDQYIFNHKEFVPQPIKLEYFSNEYYYNIINDELKMPDTSSNENIGIEEIDLFFKKENEAIDLKNTCIDKGIPEEFIKIENIASTDNDAKYKFVIADVKYLSILYDILFNVYGVNKKAEL